jgi:hypothetical protein
VTNETFASGQPATSTEELQSYLQCLKEKRLRLEATAFTEFTHPRYRAAPLHYRIAEQHERVERGEGDWRRVGPTDRRVNCSC